MWYNIPSAFPAEYCQEIIKRLSKKRTKKAEVGGNTNYENVDPNVRVTDVCFLEEIPWQDPFQDALHRYADRAIRKANCEWFGFDLSYNEAPQFTVYNSEEKGFYDWHIDRIDNNHAHPRKLSMSLLLNDSSEYSGGSLELDCPDIPKHLSKAGDAVFFPSTLRHRVTPVTEGTRYSLVCWSCGPFVR